LKTFLATLKTLLAMLGVDLKNAQFVNHPDLSAREAMHCKGLNIVEKL